MPWTDSSTGLSYLIDPHTGNSYVRGVDYNTEDAFELLKGHYLRRRSMRYLPKEVHNVPNWLTRVLGVSVLS